MGFNFVIDLVESFSKLFHSWTLMGIVIRSPDLPFAFYFIDVSFSIFIFIYLNFSENPTFLHLFMMLSLCLEKDWKTPILVCI